MIFLEVSDWRLEISFLLKYRFCNGSYRHSKVFIGYFDLKRPTFPNETGGTL